MPKITDEELASIIRAQESQAVTTAHSNLAQERAKAFKYYMGEPFGNEVEGRSQVISRDVFEAVEGMLPALLEIFLASNRIGECEPFGPEDEAEARQQSEAANHIIMKMNDPCIVFYTWFKDALIQKTGIVKTYYETEDQVRISRYEGLTSQEMTMLLADPSIETQERIVRTETIQTPEGPTEVELNDLTVKIHVNRQKVCIKNVPPEHFLITPRHTSLNLSECEFCCHKERKTATDLLEMGVEQSFLDDCGDDDSGVETSEETIARDIYRNIYQRDRDETDRSMREFWVSDAYILIDTDEDGIAELRHIIKIGNKVWLNEETDAVPFSVISPILIPHQFFGMSVADITDDVQFVKSTLWRQMLDNLYLTNNPRTAVVNGQVNLDDLLTSRPGGVVRMNAPGMATTLDTPFVAQQSFPMLEYWDSVKENRTGVTRYNQGLDADSLNKTATGINQIIGQSMKRLEMIARLFAETGVKDLFRQVLRCVSKSGMKQLIVSLSGRYVPIDPREWKNQFNITINVGIGTGNKDRTLQMLGMIGGKQLELKQTGRGYMVTEKNDFYLASKIAEAAGFRNPEVFFTNPDLIAPQAKQPPPNPDMIKMQTDAQLKQLDMKVTSMQKDKDMANDRAIEQMKAQIGAQTDIAVANIQREAQIAVANIRADTEKRTKLADVEMKGQEIEKEARFKAFDAQQQEREPMKAVEAMSGALDQSMQGLMQLLIQQNQQVSEALASLAQSNEQIAKIMLAPRKRIKDKTGRTIGMEVQGFGNVSVQ